MDDSLNELCRFGAGFVLANQENPQDPDPLSFGHNGWGGAFAFTDPDTSLGVASVMNRMLGRSEELRIRRQRMIEAVYAAL